MKSCEFKTLLFARKWLIFLFLSLVAGKMVFWKRSEWLHLEKYNNIHWKVLSSNFTLETSMEWAKIGKYEIAFVFVLMCTINSKLNGTPIGVYLPISMLHSILAVANLLAHNKWICYYVHVNSVKLK